mmetsp:Transcript_45741/g.109074  ORF Transcript_45741/g.109074 Transcript_45741/m.109074 type:complete len:208 (+) Transcript_45741:628-1251(+)
MCATSFPIPHFRTPFSRCSGALRLVMASIPRRPLCTTRASGKTCPQLPPAIWRAKSWKRGWSIPPPRQMGRTFPAPMNAWIQGMSGKTISCVAMDQRTLLGRRMTSRGIMQERSPGSSIEDAWLATVRSGTPCGRVRMAEYRNFELASSTTSILFLHPIIYFEKATVATCTIHRATCSPTGTMSVRSSRSRVDVRARPMPVWSGSGR